MLSELSPCICSIHICNALLFSELLFRGDVTYKCAPNLFAKASFFFEGVATRTRNRAFGIDRTLPGPVLVNSEVSCARGDTSLKLRFRMAFGIHFRDTPTQNKHSCNTYNVTLRVTFRVLCPAALTDRSVNKQLYSIERSGRMCRVVVDILDKSTPREEALLTEFTE